MNTIRKPRGASTDDSVYEKVIELLSTPEIVEKIKVKLGNDNPNFSKFNIQQINDFLQLFYYFIVCYSKSCFKKKAEWDKPMYNDSGRSRLEGLFNYILANSMNTHTKLLDIQSELYKYRNRYKYALKYGITFWTIDNICKFIRFTETNIKLICNEISMPVINIAPNISELVKKYNEIYPVPVKKSSLINYEVFQQLQQEHSSLLENNSNLITIELHGSRTYSS